MAWALEGSGQAPKSGSHLHLWTAGQAKGVRLLCRQTTLQRSSHCEDRRGEKRKQRESFRLLKICFMTGLKLAAEGFSLRAIFNPTISPTVDSHDFRLALERLLSRGWVLWLGPWVADLTILSMISSAVSSVQFTGSSLAEHHGGTRPKTIWLQKYCWGIKYSAGFASKKMILHQAMLNDSDRLKPLSYLRPPT